MDGMYTVYIKNTFISGFDENFRVAKRHHSYPPSPRHHGAAVQHLTFLEELEKPPSHQNHGGATVEVGEATSSGDEVPASSETLASSKRRRRRRANRPCKGKRDRYLRFMIRVCSEVCQDPTSFSLSHVAIPPSLKANPKKYRFFSDQIKSYQQQLLDGESSSGSQGLCYTNLMNLARDEAISELSEW